MPNYSVLAVSVEGSPRGCLTIREAPTSKVGEVHLTPELLDYIKDNELVENWYLNFIKVFYQECTEYDDSNQLTVNKLKEYIPEDETFKVMSIEKDYHSSTTVEDLEYRYYDN